MMMQRCVLWSRREQPIAKQGKLVNVPGFIRGMWKQPCELQVMKMAS
jgi:hypothetical protein